MSVITRSLSAGKEDLVINKALDNRPGCNSLPGVQGPRVRIDPQCRKGLQGTKETRPPVGGTHGAHQVP
ncbi:hypothetical protein BgiMline_009282 [Biomphalaria glabrata]|nr:hypothetical protein BgiMline_023424 [Biomphalaria glabrata]